MKVLNLYSGLGGNRQLWGDDHEITAVELDPALCDLYADRFPNDKVICADAHEYLIKNYENFDFIWSSPPCPSHSRARFWNTKAERIYPDFSLYQEIVFLRSHFKGKFVVENVKPYYEILLDPYEIDRHLFWTNFKVGKFKATKKDLTRIDISDVKDYNGEQRRDKIARNAVTPEIGLYLFNLAQNIITQENPNQFFLF